MAKRNDLEQAFLRWQTLAELQLKFFETLGNYKLAVAKSELVDAVAAGQWATARMKAHVAQELAAVLKRMTRLRAQTARRIRRLDRHGRDAAKIRSGEDLSVEQLALMWGGYTVFERMAPMAVLDVIINTPLHASSRRGTSYANIGHPESPCLDPPATIDNVHGLIGWIKRRRYVPRRGTQAYRQVVGAVTLIAGAADSEIQSLRKALAEMEKGTYEAWNPVVLAAIPDSIDVKKVIKLGSK